MNGLSVSGQCISRFTNRKVPYCVKFNPDEDKQNLFVAGMSDKKIVQVCLLNTLFSSDSVLNDPQLEKLLVLLGFSDSTRISQPVIKSFFIFFFSFC